MAHDPLTASSVEEDKEDLLTAARRGWNTSVPAGLGFLKWFFRLDDALREILVRFQNENRLRKAYREVGDFLYSKRHQEELDEADLVELDLLMGTVSECEGKAGIAVEKPAATTGESRSL
ncbi:MAG: hypothetical protein M1297_08470 [Nitrospirae bacterium]|jgi:hypothetical protein|nr:hypothetical protein [Nitrospirota bacterium]